MVVYSLHSMLLLQFYIKYHISAKHKWDITFRQFNTDGKMCPIFKVWKTRKQL